MNNTKTISINVNGETRDIRAHPDTPLLWILREELELTGTKYGCGIGVCGACTVAIDGEARRSCTVPVSAASGRIETIESVASGRGADLIAAWSRHNVPQCGYCQPGFVMAIAALLDRQPDVDETTLSDEISNICRCGTYQRIRQAALEVSKERRAAK